MANLQTNLTFALYRGVEQLVARRAHNPKVTGSSPVPATKTIKRLYYYIVNRFYFSDKLDYFYNDLGNYPKKFY